MIGDNIKAKREAKNMTLSELAKQCNLSVGYLSDIENNKKRNPSYDKLTKIAEVLNVPLNELVEEVVLYDADDIEVSDISKVAPVIIDALTKASNSDPIIAQAIKETIKSKDNIFFLGDLIKRVMYNAADDNLHIEFNNSDGENNLKAAIEEMISKDTETKFNKVKSFTSIPVLGIIRAGEPMYAEQNIIAHTPIPENLLNGGSEYFGLLVTGDSMNNSTIVDGSYAIVRKQDTVENGEIAVVLVDGENATVKLFYQTDTMVTLIPNSSNPEHKPRMIDLTKTEVKVLGKVVMTIKKM
jgi:repressor LexA